MSNIFYESQYGFRAKHSTINAVTEFINNVTSALDKEEATLSVFLDLSKAFDTIDHQNLLKKLEFYGIRGIALQWFKSYLSSRMQFVKYKENSSHKQLLTCGVPQGSVLGPLLFIIYTNDLAYSLNKTKSIQFADDTTLYSTHKTISELYKNVNEDLEILHDWFKANKLSLNVSKTHYMLFSNKKLKPSDQSLYMGKEKIEKKNHVKFLGLYIDDNLNWSEQINSCKLKLSSALYILNKIKHHVNIDCLKTVYYSLVYSQLTYGIILWGAAYDVHINKLVIMQKKIVRCMAKANYREHSQPLFQELNLLNLGNIYTIEVAKFMYKYVQKELPKIFLDIYASSNLIHAHNTRQVEHFRPTINRLNTSLRSILYKGPIIWNSLPVDIRQATSLNIFVSRVKKHLR